MTQEQANTKVKESKSTVGGWVLKTMYEGGMMVGTHSVAHSMFDMAKHGVKGFEFISLPVGVAAFTAEMIGEGIKSITPIGRILSPKKDSDGIITKQAKFLMREAFEATIFTFFMVACFGASSTPLGIAGLVASHYASAGIKELAKYGTDPYYKAVKCSVLGKCRDTHQKMQAMGGAAPAMA